MRTYIRDKVKGGTYFLTINLANRQSQLLTDHIDAFRHAYQLTKQNHDFELCALIVLPDHVHMLITLAENSDDYAVIVANIKTHFSRQIPKSENEVITHSRRGKREQGIWQRRFWEHRVRDELDYRRHMDYIHYNAVKMVTSRVLSIGRTRRLKNALKWEFILLIGAVLMGLSLSMIERFYYSLLG